MSGFCGWIGTPPPTDPAHAIERMAAALPPFGTQLSNSVQDGWCGLATRARTADGDWFQDERCFVAMEGHAKWSDTELAQFAKAQGHAAALARAYLEDGSALLSKLHGPVSFAIVDRQNREAFLAIDRAGIQTLCYAEVAGGLVFGSTADGVRNHPSVTATVCPQSIYDFLFFVDRIPAPNTIYREQSKLTPGSYLLFRDGRVETGRYWEMPYRDRQEGDSEQLKHELLERLRTAVEDVTSATPAASLGAFLSGGLDSSTLVALMSERLREPLKTFTIAFEDPRFDESTYAALIAERFGSEHDCFTLKPDQLEDVIVRIARAYDEPFANSSAIPTYICAERAKQAGVDTMIAGDGGDEFFAGNARYLEDRVFDHYGKIPSFVRKSAIEPCLAHMPFSQEIGLLRKAKKYVSLSSMSVAERFVRNNAFLHQDYRTIFSTAAADSIDPRAPIRFVEQMYEGLSSKEKLHRLFYVDQRLTLADSDLRKVGLMCNMADVQVRYPFLDEDLMAFSARIPPHLLMKNGRLRAFYKDAMKGILPQETLTKQKHGFGLPYVGFVQKDPALRALSKASLDTLKTYNLFCPPFLDELSAQLDHTSENANGILWDFMVLSQWLQSRNGVTLI